MVIQDLLKIVLQKKASDLHLLAGYPPVMRIDGALSPILGMEVLNREACQELVFSLLSNEQRELLEVNKEVDFSFAFEGNARFRVNAYQEKGRYSAALRLIPLRIPTIEELNLPKICHTFANLRQGFILVVGPTGHGKSTTLAAIVNEINTNSAKHIVTIEDPIEYVYPAQQGIVSQREVHLDTHSWEIALRSALREDPDVVLIGEMRDFETMAAALTIAETGHLVFASLHTNSASQTIDRIIDVFPENQQPQVRMQLSNTIEAVLSLRLVPSLSGGRYPACEIMVATPAVRTLVREAKSHQIDNIIQTSGELGMMTLESSLVALLREGKISMEVAQAFAQRPEEVARLMRGGR